MSCSEGLSAVNRNMASIRILTHNTFWCQGTPYPGADPGGPDVSILSRLTDIYRTIDPDIICLQEIQNTETTRMVTEALDQGQASADPNNSTNSLNSRFNLDSADPNNSPNSLNSRFRYQASYCRGNALPPYGGAMLWREGRFVTDSLASKQDVQRMWQIVEYLPANAAPMRICNIHLPSGRHLGPERSERQRLAELATVVHARPTPDIIAGDFNELPGGPVQTYMQEHGYTDATTITGQAAGSTVMGGSRVDYVWVRDKLRDRVTGHEAWKKENFSARPEKELLSDHLPLWITLELNNAD